MFSIGVKTRRVVNITELNFVHKPELQSGGITCHAFGIFFHSQYSLLNNYMPSALKKFGITEMVKLFNQVKKKNYECPFTTINIIFRFSLKKLKSWQGATTTTSCFLPNFFLRKATAVWPETSAPRTTTLITMQFKVKLILVFKLKNNKHLSDSSMILF